MWSGEPGIITPSKSASEVPNGRDSPSAMFRAVQRTCGGCRHRAAAQSEKFDGRPKSVRPACHAAGVPSATNMFGIRAPMIGFSIFHRGLDSTFGYGVCRPLVHVSVDGLLPEPIAGTPPGRQQPRFLPRSGVDNWMMLTHGDDSGGSATGQEIGGDRRVALQCDRAERLHPPARPQGPRRGLGDADMAGFPRGPTVRNDRD